MCTAVVSAPSRSSARTCDRCPRTRPRAGSSALPIRAPDRRRDRKRGSGGRRSSGTGAPRSHGSRHRHPASLAARHGIHRQVTSPARSADMPRLVADEQGAGLVDPGRDADCSLVPSFHDTVGARCRGRPPPPSLDQIRGAARPERVVLEAAGPRASRRAPPLGRRDVRAPFRATMTRTRDVRGGYAAGDRLMP